MFYIYRTKCPKISHYLKKNIFVIETNNKKDYNKHLISSKHKYRTTNNILEQEIPNKVLTNLLIEVIKIQKQNHDLQKQMIDVT